MRCKPPTKLERFAEWAERTARSLSSILGSLEKLIARIARFLGTIEKAIVRIVVFLIFFLGILIVLKAVLRPTSTEADPKVQGKDVSRRY